MSVPENAKWRSVMHLMLLRLLEMKNESLTRLHTYVKINRQA